VALVYRERLLQVLARVVEVAEPGKGAAQAARSPRLHGVVPEAAGGCYDSSLGCRPVSLVALVSHEIGKA